MYLNKPVRIPELPGKITYKKHGDTRYVQYEISRRYDNDLHYSHVERVVIGVQIPGRPELMLPNENYGLYFGEMKTGMDLEKNEKERLLVPDQEDAPDKAIMEYEQEREQRFILREFFEQLYYEFQMISRRRGDSIVNRNKVERLNKVLGPLLDMMSGESYAEFLELIPEPVEDEGMETTGMTYSDVALLLTQYKSAVNRFYQKMR